MWYLCGEDWCAEITMNGEQLLLGYFKSQAQAAHVYAQALKARTRGKTRQEVMELVLHLDLSGVED